MDLLLAAKEAAILAGKEVLGYYGRDVKVDMKAKNDPVTVADLRSQEVIMEFLKGFGYAFLCEEGEDNKARLNSEKVWVVDPLDGTKDFINETGEFSVMIGLVEEGKPILGVVYQPTEGRIFFAVKGQGAFVQSVNILGVDGVTEFGAPTRLVCRELERISEAAILVSRNHLKKLEQLVAKELGIERTIPCGSAGLKSCLVALGEADVYLNTSDKTSEWDLAAAEVIVNEAGGKVRDLDGNEFVYNRKDVVNREGFLVVSGSLYKEVMKVIDSYWPFS